MAALGAAAPDFALPDVTTGRTETRETVRGQKGLLVMFICAHCPYVKHVERELARLGHDYRSAGVGIVAISANDVTTHPEDSPDELAAQARRLGFAFPYLYDQSQRTARAYGAACTPDFFLYDASLSLVYRGQLDDSRPGSGLPVTGRDLRAAIDAVAGGSAIDAVQKPSMGCNIKWKQA
jgi:peroxiredoxin